MVKVKICGLTNVCDALKACESGADLIGFVFVGGTPRKVSPLDVKNILSEVRKVYGEKILSIGLFLNESISNVVEIIGSTGINAVQLHGDETPEYCMKLKEVVSNRLELIKVFKVFYGEVLCDKHKPQEYDSADYYLFDTFHPGIPGGTGSKFDWDKLSQCDKIFNKPFFVAGGLTPNNVSEAVKKIKPYGVDVSSGVELHVGKKDEKLLKEFILNAKGK